VLPFKTIGNEQENAYLGLGMADALITKLSGFKQLRVRPTSAVVKYANINQDPFAAGHDLRVEAVVEGSIWQISERLRVTVQLVKASLWADKFDETFSDIFTILYSISERVAQVLEFQLTNSDRRRLAKRATENLSAYQFLMRAFYYMNQFTPQSTAKAVPELEKAIEIDPDYALAYAYLAGCNILLTTLGVVPTSAVADKIRFLSAKALTLDETLPSANYAQAFAYFFYDRDFDKAEQAFRRAVELNPHDAFANKHYSIYLFSVGRFEESINLANTAYELDPLTTGNTAHLGLVYYYARQFDKALLWYHKALEKDPHFLNSQIGLALTFAKKEMFAEALSAIRNVDASFHEQPHCIAALGCIFALAGNTKAARECLKKLLEMSQTRYVSAYEIAVVHAGLGDAEQAFDWLEKAFEEKALWLIYIWVDPRLDLLRSDSRFANLLERLGFFNASLQISRGLF
jgi:TolB-like protein/Flp pilus assembly protein TadD